MREIGEGLEGAWNAFLELLARIITPDWNDVIGWLPVLTVIGLLGPILTLLALYWLWTMWKAERPRVRYDEPAPVAAERDAEGYFIVPPNTPYCPRDGLIYPATAKDCERDGGELVVRCPVDQTTRTAREELCRVCGTRYVLGAGSAALTVTRRQGPPEGGAAVA